MGWDGADQDKEEKSAQLEGEATRSQAWSLE